MKKIKQSRRLNATLSRLYSQPAGRFEMCWYKLFLLFISLSSSVSHACLSVEVTADDLDFGGYNPFDRAPTQSQLSVTVDCLADGLSLGLSLPFQVGLSSALSGATQRKLVSDGYELSYQIYNSPSLATPWGEAGSGSLLAGLFPVSLLDQTQLFTGFALIPAGQDVPAGVYTDSILVTIEF
ncbi:Csu type fimbrial protein [Arenicella xantha]|nr:spore coat U domain-containing protein [Arenicella xantha]